LLRRNVLRSRTFRAPLTDQNMPEFLSRFPTTSESSMKRDSASQRSSRSFVSCLSQKRRSVFLRPRAVWECQEGLCGPVRVFLEGDLPGAWPPDCGLRLHAGRISLAAHAGQMIPSSHRSPVRYARQTASVGNLSRIWSAVFGRAMLHIVARGVHTQI